MNLSLDWQTFKTYLEFYAPFAYTAFALVFVFAFVGTLGRHIIRSIEKLFLVRDYSSPRVSYEPYVYEPADPATYDAPVTPSHSDDDDEADYPKQQVGPTSCPHCGARMHWHYELYKVCEYCDMQVWAFGLMPQ